MFLRLLALALTCSIATAQTQIDWTNSIASGGGGTAVQGAVCFDVPGLTIYSALSTTPSWHGELRCIDAQGQTIWTVQPQVGSAPISITSIAYDGNGRIAAAGLARSPANVPEEAYVIVYDLAGNPLWNATWAGPSGEPWNSVRIAGFASNGPVLAGTYLALPNFNRDVGAVALDASGGARWQWSAATADDDYLFGTALAANDELYLVGLAADPVFFGESGFATKITASGATAWSVHPAADKYACVAIDAQGRPHVAGNRANGTLLLMARLDPSTGQQVHAHTMTSDGQSGMSAIAVAPNGDVVATGTRFIYISGIGHHGFTIALDANGIERWRAAHRAPLPLSGAFAGAIDIDSAGDVAISGWEFDQYQTHRPFVVKYPRSIAPAVGWASTDPPAIPVPFGATARELRIDPNGGVRVLGAIWNASGAGEIVTWRLAPSARTVCVGDGSTTTCPCGNESTAFERAGCLSSIGLGGKLEWRGVPSLGGDSLLFAASGLPPSTTALLAQGQGAATPAVSFGDGLACIGNPVVRLGTGTAQLGRIAFPIGYPWTHISVQGGVTGPGAVHTYQVRYRNAAAFCTTESWNSTNAIEVTWLP